MKKTKILLVGALLFGVPSVALSLSTQQENATVVRAATTSSTTINISSGTTINDGWKVSDNSKFIDAGDYFKLYGGAYIENTDYITINCKQEVTLTIGARKFGGPTVEQCKISLDILNQNGDLMGTTQTISPTTKGNESYSIKFAFNESYLSNNIQKVKIRISSSKASTKDRMAGYYSLSLNYYAEEATLISEIKNVETQTKLKFDYTKTIKTEIKDITPTTFDFSSMNLKNGAEVSSFDNNNFNVLFSKGESSNAPKYYTTGNGVRTYAKSNITISSEKEIKTVKLILGSGSDSLNITANNGKITTNTKTEKEIININSTNLVITVGGTSGHLRIQQIIINENGGQEEVETAHYSNFSNLQLQYRYSFDVSSYIDEVQEIGMFVTDDANFEFNTDGIYDDELTFESQVKTDKGFKGMRFINSSKKDTYTIGINLGNEIEGALITTFRVGTYVKTNNKYYFSPKISTYNLESLLKEYNKMELEGENNAVISSFLAYATSLL